MSNEHGAWSPLSPAEVHRLLTGAPFRWWLTGGLALEQFAGTSWREHDDIDVGVCRGELDSVYDWLVERGQYLFVAAQGVLAPWHGRMLDEAAGENNLWMRPSPNAAWVLDITVGDGDDSIWTFRRDKQIRREWGAVLQSTTSGLPFLAPEIQLLFKSGDVRPKDTFDALRVIPLLDIVQLDWLSSHLPLHHVWHELIERSRAASTPERSGRGSSER